MNGVKPAFHVKLSLPAVSMSCSQFHSVSIFDSINCGSTYHIKILTIVFNQIGMASTLAKCMVPELRQLCIEKGLDIDAVGKINETQLKALLDCSASMSDYCAVATNARECDESDAESMKRILTEFFRSGRFRNACRD